MIVAHVMGLTVWWACILTAASAYERYVWDADERAHGCPEAIALVLIAWVITLVEALL
jgi:hypothetical protein